MAWKSIMSSPRVKAKMKKTLGEFKRGKLRSGSKKGAKVKDRKQAIAIAISQAKKAVGAKS